MRLDTEFVRLPLRVDAGLLAEEVARIPESAWRPHPQGYKGNSALALLSAHGDPQSDDVAGPMRPTPHLATLPYLQDVLHGLHSVIGRTRLMRLDGNAEATTHADINYYWFDRVRVHVPVVTHPDVTFHCGARALHMAAGEVWIFNTWQPHNVINPRETRRIHLVADTVGSARFWSLVESGYRVFASDRRPPAADSKIERRLSSRRDLPCESWNFPDLMEPAQLEAVIAQILETMAMEDPQAVALAGLLRSFGREWRALWSEHGRAQDNRAPYRDLSERFSRDLMQASAGLRLQNGVSADRTLRELILRPLLSTQQSQLEPAAVPKLAGSAAPEIGSNPEPEPQTRSTHRSSRFDRPIFIVSPPRSGSSLLFETLTQSPDLWSIGGESHRAIEGIAALHPLERGFESNRLTAREAHDAVVVQLEESWWQSLHDRDGKVPTGTAPLRLLEKTPKNSLRIPFLKAAFPDAYFVYLYRDPRDTLSSMLEAWRSGRFVTYPKLPGWDGLPWSLLLTPGWRELSGRSLAEAVAQQWAVTTNIMLDDLEALSPDSWCIASYDRLTSNAAAEVTRICRFLRVRWDRPLEGPLPASRTTLTAPKADKWRKNTADLEVMMPIVRDAASRAKSMFATAPQDKPDTASAFATAGQQARASQPTAAKAAPASASMDFRSVYTKGFPQLLKQIGATLVVTTYQSGRVILVRADGDELNTHLRSFPSPMGVAVAKGRLTLGTQREIWEFFDVPDVAAKLEPKGKHDAAYLPRRSAITGDIRVHELAYAGEELWMVNTRFSCLCTMDSQHSFVPRWRPPFVTALAPEDRCHLNGMCIVDGQVRYVTALGQSDTAGGWRASKADGGVVLEVPSGRVVAQGLSMPHSPRVREGALWVLESGKGEIGTVDMATQSVRPIAQLDGFTRGLTFAGPYAFVGLSQVRESNVFGGIPLTSRVKERQCGVWVIDTRDGKTAAFLRFEGSVQEIFDIQLLHGARYAELLEPNADVLATTYALPGEALDQVPAELKVKPAP